MVLYQLLFVDHQFELKPQLFRRLAAEKHRLEEDCKAVYNSAFQSLGKRRVKVVPPPGVLFISILA